jgi:hypothetical protein
MIRLLRSVRISALAALLLAAGCGALDANVEAKTACYTLPDYAIDGVAGAGQLATPLELDLGSVLPVLTEPGVSYDLRLRDVSLALSSSSPLADLGGVESFTASAVAPPGSGLDAPELVRYDRPPGPDLHPTSLSAHVVSDRDLARYVTGGLLRLDAAAAGTLPAAPWRATVTACFLLNVNMNYGSRL